MRGSVHKKLTLNWLSPCRDLLVADRLIRTRVVRAKRVTVPAPWDDRLYELVIIRVAPPFSIIRRLPLVHAPEPVLPEPLLRDKGPDRFIDHARLFRQRPNRVQGLRDMKRILCREVLDPVLHRGHVGRTPGEGFFGWRLPDPGPGIMVVPAFGNRVLDVFSIVIGMRRPPVSDGHGRVRRFVVPIDEVRLLRFRQRLPGHGIGVGIVRFPLALDQPFDPAMSDVDPVALLCSEHADDQLLLTLPGVGPRAFGGAGGFELGVAVRVIYFAFEQQVRLGLQPDAAARSTSVIAKSANAIPQTAGTPQNVLLLLFDLDDQVFIQDDREAPSRPRPNESFDQSGLFRDHAFERRFTVLGLEREDAPLLDHRTVFLHHQVSGPADEFVRGVRWLHPGRQASLHQPPADFGAAFVDIRSGYQRKRERTTLVAIAVGARMEFDPAGIGTELRAALEDGFGRQPERRNSRVGGRLSHRFPTTSAARADSLMLTVICRLIFFLPVPVSMPRRLGYGASNRQLLPGALGH